MPSRKKNRRAEGEEERYGYEGLMARNVSLERVCDGPIANWNSNTSQVPLHYWIDSTTGRGVLSYFTIAFFAPAVLYRSSDGLAELVVMPLFLG